MATPAELRDQLRAREDKAMARICAAARDHGEQSISGTTIAAARKALTIAQKIRAADSLQTSAAEMRALRVDSAVLAAIEKDLRRFAVWLDDAMQGWLELGWTIKAEGDTQILEAEGGPKATVRLTDDVRTGLARCNLMGHTKAEMIVWLTNMLRYDISGALGLCLVTTAGDAVVGQLGTVAAQLGGKLDQQARQSFLAGAGQASDTITRALTGVGR